VIIRSQHLWAMSHQGKLLIHTGPVYPMNKKYRCILLLEDLDAAFTRSVSRDASSTGVPTNGAAPSGSAATNSNTTTPTPPPESDGSTLSLSGLLNSLDGVAAAEGRFVVPCGFPFRCIQLIFTAFFLRPRTISSGSTLH
jgi:hypothetical protein